MRRKVLVEGLVLGLIEIVEELVDALDLSGLHNIIDAL
jgi:hypothetical protein